MKLYAKILSILLFFSVFAGNANAYVVPMHTYRAAVNQEIYNWVDIVNESGASILFYMDGTLIYGNTVSDRRLFFPAKFTQTGNHVFTINAVLSDGSSWNNQWTITVYNPTRSLQGAIYYADKYAILPNPWYRPFASDCTNFVSQILGDDSGGRFPMSIMPGGWYYSNWFDYSNSWTVVTDFYAYTVAQGFVEAYSGVGWAVTIGGQNTFIYPPIANGDTERFKFANGNNHNTFVETYGISDYDGTYQPLIDAHTAPHYHSDWRLLSGLGSDWINTTLTNYHFKWDY